MINYIKLLKYAPILIVAALVAALFYQNTSLKKDLEMLEVKTSIIEANNTVLEGNIEHLSKLSREQRDRVERLAEKSQQAIISTNKVIKELDGYKSREKIVVAKPSLIERRANDAVSRLLREYECASSNQCDPSDGDN